jgi:fluoride exporter
VSLGPIEPIVERAHGEARTALARPHPSRIPSRLHAAVAIGGAAGAAARVELERLLPAPAGGWPWMTFGINVAGAFLLGYLATRLLERLPPSTYRSPFVGTGFCGALTTFSTMQIEMLRLMRGGHIGLAIAYGGTSIVCGLLAVFLATRLVRRARWRKA